MGSIKKIMVALDFSEYSLPCIRQAGEIATALGAELLLVNVINQWKIDSVERIFGPNESFSIEQWIEDSKRERLGKMAVLMDEAGCGALPCQKIVRVGIHYQELLFVIDEERPDLLVMATKGRSNLADTIIGSCAHKMYRRSPIAMLSVRARERSGG